MSYYNIPLVSLIKMLKFWRLFITILMLLMLKSFNYFNFSTMSERWVMWLILKMCEMFISQGWSRSHLLKKLGWGLSDSGWLVSCSMCCTGHLCGTSSGWILQNNCSWRFPWSVHWCGSCRYSWLWFWCYWSNWVQPLGLLALVSLGTTQVRTLV